MQTLTRNHLRNQHGQSMITVLVAAALIVCALAGVGVSSSFLRQATKAKELATLAVALESNFVSAFQNKENYPDPNPAAPAGGGSSPNLALRKGTITSFNLQTTIGTLVVPVQSTNTGPGVVGFLDWALQPCGAFDGRNCVLRYELHLKKTLACGPPTCSAGKEIYAYAFSYQISVDPSINDMAPLGKATSFDTPIDPGYYRVEASLAQCDPGSDLFMTGLNRDTGEAFCVKKPVNAKCPQGTIPKGLIYHISDVNPTIELDCTASVLRKISCDDNYALQEFNPQYADPESSLHSPSGTCVFRAAKNAVVPGTFPPNPAPPYMKKVQGTFCPIFYKPDMTSGGCQLVPDDVRNADTGPTGGRGYCAFSSGIKSCTRSSYDRYWYDNSAAYDAWLVAHGPTSPECVARQAMIPPQACDPAPSTGWWVYTCGSAGSVEHAAECGNNPGTADDPNGCTQKGPWSGTPYAYNFQQVAPTAIPSPSMGPGARGFTCQFQDTSPPCPAMPNRDYNGNLWTAKNPKWYGGVKVSGLNCTYDPSQNGGKGETMAPH